MQFATPDLIPELELTSEEQNRSRLLDETIRNQIRNSKHKAITFSSFMNLALYAPLHGYYAAAPSVVGAEGDFVTAPELGDVFGKVLARKIADSCADFSGLPTLYEFGAGNGTLAVQILKELERIGFETAKYEIMELSPALQRIQRDTINRETHHIQDKIRWRTSLPESGMDGIVIANEVVDAMPVELFRRTSDGPRQGYVVETEHGIAVDYQSRVQPDFQISYDAVEFPEIDGSMTSELHCQAEAWVRTLAESINVGSILVVDYGFPEHEYYHPDRKQGTLVCHRRHRLLYDPLAYIGCQDISAHVNFSGLARAATESGMEVNGFTNLGSFVADVGIGAGILDDMAEGMNQNSRQLDKLCHPHEMGEIFKVMELTKNSESTGLGFSLSDRTHRLHVSDPICELSG